MSKIAVPAVSRRSFLKQSSAALASASLAAAGFPARASAAEPVIHEGRFVPEGADGRFVFVSDHHYWPDHLENWGGGAQITTNCGRRMPDLIEALNHERPGLSVHAGDVISAGGSFFPPPEEYARQLAFTRRLYDRLSHPVIPLLGNHETQDARVASDTQFEPWIRHFGAPYRSHDLKGWRIVGLNCVLPNPEGRFGKGDGNGNVYGLDDAQLAWLEAKLGDAARLGLKAVLCAHIPPGQWINAAAVEKAIAASGCVKAVLCGHTHRNTRSSMGGVPVLTRAANVTSPFAYHLVHLYPDGRILIVQKSQHFPFDDFVSSAIQPGGQGAETDRYLTLGGNSDLPLQGIGVRGEGARAAIADGHLRLVSEKGRAVALIETGDLRNARLHLTAVKASGERMGALALAGEDGEGGIEATLTSRYSPDGKVYLAARGAGRREVLARSWFNIADNIAYRLTLEVRDGRVSASWKNMLNLQARVKPSSSGRFGFFIERGTMFVTELTLERM